MRTIGIDLGTTNTVAAIDGTVVQHASGLETSAILPSVVAYPPSGAVLVGATARKRRAIDPKNTIYSAKRVIGQRWLSYSASKYRKQYPFDMVEAVGGLCAFKTRAGIVSPVDVAARIVDKLFAGHSMLRNEVNAVVTVPAAFDTGARRATIAAAEQAGLTRVELVDEPVATAMAYVTMRSERARYAAVYDLGGGTFDLALIDCSVTPARVIRHAGDAYLGGDDIDRAIAEWVSAQVLERFGWELDNDPEVRDRLLVECEQAKIRLTSEPRTTIQLARVDPAAPQAAEQVEVDQDTVNGLVQDHVTRTFMLCDQVLREAQLSPSQIDVVYLAGGATMMPLVQQGVAHYFGALPRVEFDPMQVVAVGASLAG
ncbi:MAG: Hsp70 family protein [Myxococcales bacterium]|nr:Hsp70 family protein [Myxococcales bacterium]